MLFIVQEWTFDVNKTFNRVRQTWQKYGTFYAFPSVCRSKTKIISINNDATPRMLDKYQLYYKWTS